MSADSDPRSNGRSWAHPPGQTPWGRRGLLFAALLLGAVLVVAEWAIPSEIERHDVWITDGAIPGCSHPVSLEFHDSPGYFLETCSEELLDKLHTHASFIVPVDLHRDYSLGSWEYTVTNVGGWKRTAEWNISLRPSAAIYPRPAGRFPLRRPYSMR